MFYWIINIVYCMFKLKYSHSWLVLIADKHYQPYFAIVKILGLLFLKVLFIIGTVMDSIFFILTNFSLKPIKVRESLALDFYQAHQSVTH